MYIFAVNITLNVDTLVQRPVMIDTLKNTTGLSWLQSLMVVGKTKQSRTSLHLTYVNMTEIKVKLVRFINKLKLSIDYKTFFFLLVVPQFEECVCVCGGGGCQSQNESCTRWKDFFYLTSSINF